MHSIYSSGERLGCGGGEMEMSIFPAPKEKRLDTIPDWFPLRSIIRTVGTE